ncbi:MAG: hypothetical protein H6811_08015 [Phycisphaeraceae bacterium]|nr:hypothetical protein [Phycisphaeraceae bacterium]
MTTPSTSSLNLNATLAFRIAELTAAPTPDWPDEAAAVLADLPGVSASAVVIGSVRSNGEIDALECAGVSIRRPLSASARAVIRASIASMRTLGINLPDPSGTSVERSMPGGAWRGSAVALAMGPLEPADLILAWAPIRGNERGVLVALSLDDPDVGTIRAQAASLAPLVAARARIALGDRPMDRSGWLTRCEVEVLERLVLGLSVREIAEDIGRSPHTIHDHVKSLHRKLGASTRGALVARALGRPTRDESGVLTFDARHQPAETRAISA